MPHLWLLTSVWIILGLGTPASAQVCCPVGCIQDAARCVTADASRRPCARVPCRGGGGVPGGVGRGSGSGVGGGGGVGPPVRVCFQAVGPAQIDQFTDQCVAQLTGTMQFWACAFEDAAGRAEDLRTGLSCRDRQAALAKQCRARCSAYLTSLTTCNNYTEQWQAAFGDIGGSAIGYAQIEQCGPRLRSNPRARPFNPNVLAPPAAVPFTPSPFIFR
jgi:hypothetical protein